MLGTPIGKGKRGGRPSLAARCVVACWLACAMLATGHAQAATPEQDMARMDALYQQGEQDTTAALKELAAWHAQMPATAPYAVQRHYWKTYVALLTESGQMQAAAAPSAEFLKLTKAQGDSAGIAMATAFEAIILTDTGKPSLALARLGDIGTQAQQNADPELLRRYHDAYGVAYLALTKFEQALPHFLKALEYADQQKTNTKVARLRQLSRVSDMYLAMKNAEKGLAVIEESLALASELGFKKMQATLYLYQGFALAELGRRPESILANERALQISREAGLLRTEATVLTNISDSYLVARDFVKAAAIARQAIAKAHEAGSRNTLATATSNLGFALIGQGHMAEGVAQVRESLKLIRDAGSLASEESTLAELGRMQEEAGLFRDALATLREQQKISRKLYSSDRARSVAALQEEFDTVQRQKQIELLARENNLKDAELSNRRLQQVVTLLGAVVVVMASVFVLLLYRRVRKTNRKLREANRQLEFHSVRDPLTGLFNRRSFLDLMKRRPQEGDADRRAEDAHNPDGLMIMDIDHFKQINDTWGHAAGDAVLVEVASRLRSTVRDSDMVMRWGGEEFLIFSSKANSAQQKRLAERLLQAVGGSPIQVGDNAIPVTITAGFLTLPFSGLPEAQCNWEKAMQIADMALYMGKLHGRNRAYGLARLLVPPEQAMPVLENDLAAALSAGMVELIEVLGPTKAQ